MRRVKTPFVSAILASFALWSLSAGAVGPSTMNVTGTQISWHAKATAGYKLTISGPGGVKHHIFEVGEPPILSVYTQDGYLKEDGSYTWELRSLPTQTREQPQVEWGYVTIQNGAFQAHELEEVVDDKPKAPIMRDVKIADDLVVQGSACIGVDCVDDEIFDLDTLRLKEDILRIKLEDTSGVGSPSNDWQVTVNDSVSGGGDRFSIDDLDSGETPFTIEAGAPSNSLYVDDVGRVGLGTATPSGSLHVMGSSTSNPVIFLESTDGAQATWRIRNTPANGRMTFNDVGGNTPFKFAPNAQNNLLRVGIADDGIGGSSDDANTVSIGTAVPGEDAAVLDVYGSIKVNGDSSTPSASSARLHILGNALNDPDIYLEATSGFYPKTWRIRNSPNNGRLTFNDVGGNVGIKIASGAQNNLLRIGISDNGIGISTNNANTVVIGSGTAGENAAVLQVFGSIEVNGLTVHSDYVFQPDYVLPSIEDHASFMWTNSHLPGLPKAPEGMVGTVDIAAHQMGILEELETAHIYIDQLNNLVKNQDNQLKAQDRQLQDQSQVLEDQSRLLLEQSRALEDLQQRLAALEELQG